MTTFVEIQGEPLALEIYEPAHHLAMQDQMAAELHAQLTIISGAGHCPNEDKPEETAAVLANFWRAL